MNLKALISFLFIINAFIAYSQEDYSSEYLYKILKNDNIINIEFEISNHHFDKNLGIDFYYLQQLYVGLPILNSIKTVVLKNNTLAYTSGSFFTKFNESIENNIPTINVINAIKIASNHLGLVLTDSLYLIEKYKSPNNTFSFPPAGISKKEITTQLIWVVDEDRKTLSLAWNIEIDVINSSDDWIIQINANTGEIIGQQNLTVYEALTSVLNKKYNSSPQEIKTKTNTTSDLKKYAPSLVTAYYNVVPYPFDNRFVGYVGLEVNPWTKVGSNNNATTYKWHYDGTNNYNYTRGNNVYAYDDSLNKNAPGRSDTSITAGTILTFKRTPVFTNQPTSTTNRQFATDNLFYWNNIMHDLFYQYGFTEAAGNFQNDNMGRGGIGGDYLKAEAQDGSGISNANFTTPSDGFSGKMQMYLYTPKTTNIINISTPSAIAGNYFAPESNVSPNNLLKKTGTITGYLIYYNDSATSTTTHNACKSPSNIINGRIAFINKASCSYATQIKFAQAAGAIAVIMCNPLGSASVMTGSDTSIRIPAVMVSNTDGALIAKQLLAGAIVSATLFSPVFYDGALDNGIISHEYAHGISIRLTGGASNVSCLNNAEQGGEGWSDYISLMATTNWKTAKITDGNKSISHACYAYSQISAGLGNRTYPYSTDMTINPHTYADLAQNGQVHYIGEVWCSTLWDMTWNIIQQTGTINKDLFNANGYGGNSIVLQLVMLGFKLQPCSPGFIDARNAILAADSILYGGLYKCAIWNAFARRGMGFSASQGSSASTTDQIVAFDIPCISVNGNVINTQNKAIPNVTIQYNNGISNQKTTTSNSIFSINLPYYTKNNITATKNNDINKTNGVSVIDATLIQAHLLNKSLLSTPYKIIAADVDNSGSVSVIDILYLKRLILGIDTTFKGNRLWAFVDSSYTFSNPQNPFPYKDSFLVDKQTTSQTNKTFIGMKLGDVNDDWDATILKTTPIKTLPIGLYYDTLVLNNNTEINIPIKIKNFKDIRAFQFTLNFDSNIVEWKNVSQNNLGVDIGSNHSKEGKISFLWTDKDFNVQSLADGSVLFNLVFNKKTDFQNALITLSSDITPIEAWDKQLRFYSIEQENKKNTTINTPINYKEYWDIYPNPTSENAIQAIIQVEKNKLICFKLISIDGKELASITIYVLEGKNVFSLPFSEKIQLKRGAYFIQAVGLKASSTRKINIY